MLSTFLELQRWIVFLFFVSYSFKVNSRRNLYWVSDGLIKLANKCINSNLALLSYACQKYYCYSFFEMYQQCHCWYEQNFCCYMHNFSSFDPSCSVYCIQYGLIQTRLAQKYLCLLLSNVCFSFA